MIKGHVSEGLISHNKIEQNIKSTLHYGDIGTVKFIVLHRTTNDSIESTLRGFETKRGSYYYGTHFLIGFDGRILQTANLNKYTLHSGGNNRKSIGIEVVGKSLDEDGNWSLGRANEKPVVAWDPVTDRQAKAVACLVRALLKYYDLTKEEIKVHEELNAKTIGEGQVVYDAIINLIP